MQEQLEFQAANYSPPHSKASMISEAAMKSASEAVGSVHEVDASEDHMNVVDAVNKDV